MRKLSHEEVRRVLARSSELARDVESRLHVLNMKASDSESVEGYLLAITLRPVQEQLSDVLEHLSEIADSYN